MGSFQDKADLDAAAHTTRDVMAFRLGLPDHDAALSGSQETEGTLGTHNVIQAMNISRKPRSALPWGKMV